MTLMYRESEVSVTPAAKTAAARLQACIYSIV